MPSFPGQNLVNGNHSPARPDSLSPTRPLQDDRLRTRIENGASRPNSKGSDVSQGRVRGQGEDGGPRGVHFAHQTNGRVESPAHNGPSSPKAHASPAGAPPRADIPQSAAQLPPSLTSRQFNKLRAMAARPEDFDLAAPVEDGNRLGLEKVERLTDLLFAPLHLRAIFLDPAALLRFTSFLAAHRPQSLPTLVYFLDATKAIKAIDYANAVAHALEAVDDPELDAEDENGDSEDGRGSASISKPLAPIKEVTANNELRAQAERAFDLLVRLDLPAYTAYMFTQVIKARTIIPLNRAPKIDENFQGFAEVFCLTDPRRTDNPIIFASPAFHQMTQYSMNYIIGRNCRFLQGPRTNRASPKRIRRALDSNVPHWEVFVNYRRDGAPFLNLLLCTPLFDEWGAVRYHLGAQIDVSEVVDDAPELESLQRTVARSERLPANPSPADFEKAARQWQEDDAFQSFVEMLDMQELQAIRAWEERLQRAAGPSPPSTDSGMGRGDYGDGESSWVRERRPGLPIKHQHNTTPIRGMHYGLYDKFLLVRPAPSLRILFASPSLSTPGMIQARILDKLAVSGRVRFELNQALEEGREVTAKVGWRGASEEEARTRWIVFTPLVGRRGNVGVWMVILEDHIPDAAARRPNVAPNRASFAAGRQPVDGPHGVIAEEAEGDFDDELPVPTGPAASLAPAVPPRGAFRHGPKISWSGPEVPPELRSPTLNWVETRDQTAVYGMGGDADGWDSGREERGVYVSLEERLRKKREREGMLLGSGAAGVGLGPGPLDGTGAGLVPVRRTYKSLSPDTFINTSD